MLSAPAAVAALRGKTALDPPLKNDRCYMKCGHSSLSVSIWMKIYNVVRNLFRVMAWELVFSSGHGPGGHDPK